MVELCLFYEDATSCMYYAFKSFHLQKTLDRSICTNLTLSFLIICGKFTVLIIFPRLQELKYKIILSAMLLYFILFYLNFHIWYKITYFIVSFSVSYLNISFLHAITSRFDMQMLIINSNC